MTITLLASSSKGNTSLLSTADKHYLIDAGISALRLRAGLAQCGLSMSQISGIFITHEHRDHCCGLGQLAKKNDLLIYATQRCSRDLREMAPQARFHYILPGEKLELDDLTVLPITAHHDALDHICFIFECKGARLGYITDTGHICDKITEACQQLDALCVESNYDEGMLRSSSRPLSLITRIACNWGHLSNEQCAQFVKSIASERLRNIVLLHLSQDCNTPELALKSMNSLQLSARIRCAHPNHPIQPICITC